MREEMSTSSTDDVYCLRSNNMAAAPEATTGTFDWSDIVWGYWRRI
jgi:hypothetical protein